MTSSLVGLLVSVVLLSTAARAQAPCYAENDGTGFRDASGMGGPNLLLAVRFTAPGAITCERIEVFTGEGSGTNTVAIWSHDPVGNRPGAELASGSWSMDLINGWQGAALSSPVPLTSGTVYWMAWAPIGASQASIEFPTSALGQPYRLSFNGGVHWGSLLQFTDIHWKFRLFGTCAGAGPGSFCFGDGVQAACPCANSGYAGRGCDNSIQTGGARLSTSGTTAPDTLVLTASSVRPAGLSIFLQGDSSIAPVPFGDGLLCIGGTLLRLYAKHAQEGWVSAPAAGEPSITAISSALGGPIAPGTARFYQVYYRDPDGTFCPTPAGNVWNASSAVQVDW